MAIAPDDLTLTSAVAAGDTAAEETFAKKFRAKLVYLAGKRGVPTVDCEDVAHETIITAIDQIRRGIFRGESSIGTWLDKILAGKTADFWRKSSNRLQPVSLDPEDERLHTGTAVALVSTRSDPVQQLIVQQILSRMSPRHRRILLMNQRDGYTTKEISKLVRLPAGTVGRLLAEAKAIFKDSILNSEESGGERRQEG